MLDDRKIKEDRIKKSKKDKNEKRC